MERMTWKSSIGGYEDTGLRTGVTVGDAICQLAAYEDSGLMPEEITAEKPGCVFYCNRQCNLNGDFCSEGPGCPLELDADAAMRRLTTPPNNPLTLEELREMAQRCDGVYVENTDGRPLLRDQNYCAAVLDERPVFGAGGTHIEAIYGDKLTLKEAIAHCHQVAASAKGKKCPKCAAEHIQLAKWLEELQARRQEEAVSNNLLTLDELKKLIGEPVWVVDTVNRTGWAVVSSEWRYENYGETWWAYRNKQVFVCMRMGTPCSMCTPGPYAYRKQKEG